MRESDRPRRFPWKQLIVSFFALAFVVAWLIGSYLNSDEKKCAAMCSKTGVAEFHPAAGCSQYACSCK